MIFVFTCAKKDHQKFNLEKFRKYPRHRGHVYSIRRQGQKKDDTRQVFTDNAQGI